MCWCRSGRASHRATSRASRAMKDPSVTWPVSAMLTSLPLDFGPACLQAASLGFTHVDLIGLVDRPAEHHEELAVDGLLVSCTAVGKGLPDGQTLDAATLDARRAALDLVQLQIADAARLGA